MKFLSFLGKLFTHNIPLKLLAAGNSPLILLLLHLDPPFYSIFHVGVR